MSRISVVDEAHAHVRKVVRPGDFVVDATVGNGHDAVFLCEQVGQDGLVIGVDIQPSAIAATRALLVATGLEARCRLVQAGHGDLARIVSELAPGRLASVVMFNLGYLPGGNKDVTTVADTTVAGLAAALAITKPGGLVTIVVYRGHADGVEEAGAIEDWIATLVKPDCHAEWSGKDDAPDHYPYLITLCKS